MIAGSLTAREKLLNDIERMESRRSALSTTQPSSVASAEEIAQRVEALGTALERGNAALVAMDRKPLLGHIQNIEQYSSAMSRLQMQMRELRASIKAVGEAETLTADQRVYHLARGREAVEELRRRMEALNDAGRRSFEGWKGGLDQYVESLEAKSVRIANTITRVFKGLEDAIAEMIVSTELNWKRMVDMLVGELARLGVQQYITGPMAAGFSAMFPTPAQLSGEAPLPAGTVMPRAARGDGVNVAVYDNRSADQPPVQVVSRVASNGTREVDVIVEGAVNRAIQSGALDKQMRSVYGSQRRGG